MNRPPAVDSAVRLVDGAWALATPAGVWVGVLGGDFSSGWRSSVGLIPAADVATVQQVLRAGGRFTGAAVPGGGTTHDATAHDGGHRSTAGGCAVSVTVDGGTAVVAIDGAEDVCLDVEATARLQVLCSMCGVAGAAPRPTFIAGAPVRSSRASIEVDVETLDLVGGAVGGVSASDPGIVSIDVVQADGPAPTSLTLPALPVLLAAAEAGRDGRALVLRLRAPDGVVVSAELPAPAATSAAADAQWLLPTLMRRAASAGASSR